MPGTSVECSDNLNKFLCDHVKPRTRLLLGGDFNLFHVNWERLEADKDDVTNSEKQPEFSFNHRITEVV